MENQRAYELMELPTYSDGHLKRLNQINTKDNIFFMDSVVSTHA